jgi:hypothetical protein
MEGHFFSRCVEEAQLVRQFEDALHLGRASLNDCRRLVAQASDTHQDPKRLYGTFELRHFQAVEQEARWQCRLDCVLHTNATLRKQIQSIREKVPIAARLS